MKAATIRRTPKSFKRNRDWPHVGASPGIVMQSLELSVCDDNQFVLNSVDARFEFRHAFRDAAIGRSRDRSTQDHRAILDADADTRLGQRGDALFQRLDNRTGRGGRFHR